MLLLSKILITSAIILLILATISLTLAETIFINKWKALINTGIVLGILGLLSYISVVFMIIWY